MNLTKKIIISLILGLIVGLGFNLFAPNSFEVVDAYLLTPLGTIFLKSIMMLVVPLVLFSIILGTAGISDPKKLGRIGGKTIAFYLITTAIALIIGLSMAYIIQPGAGGVFETTTADFEARQAPPVVETLLNIIPTNPIDAMAKGTMLQIIAFAVLIGFALARLGEKTKGLLNLVAQGNEVMMYLVNLVMLLAPYGAFALIASAIGKLGLNALQAMILYMIAVLGALIIHALVTYGSAVAFLAKRNPIEFFKKFSPAMIVAFSTSSSSATLPVSMRTAQENLNVSKSVSSFVQPLGATINMDGTAIMQAVATVFIAQVYLIDLTFGDLLTVILTATLASIGTAGVPGVGLIMLTMVLTSVGLPVEGVALVLAVDRILDMTRTAVNITGDAACAVVVSSGEDQNNLKQQKTA
ncbi:dicarboxylate/amino acid:cation symporter [Anaerobacillus alkalilacustris]|uniref:Dicarboxylate/amino acid:cation symporter n=1 Tax=Anaerobacillus alkalilacustris TaxID=393763 RepID=A0A1S2LZ52_9BACI|nr:dicarboxylate/amino acid:cation symporter [Anaerobacillus alkalilacustris]OIJ17626.1 dicarboxylate/amino acid:cation symporter [Anaerobacillus alkalilacustris]